MPAQVAKIRRDLCPACDCQSDPLNPCHSCPKGNWGPWMRCTPESAPAPAPGFPAKPTPRPPGPGTILKQTLARLFITPQDGSCKCNARAAQMDTNGPDWCQNNLDLIITWLQEEATRRKLPFSPKAARFLVRRAINKSRRLQAPSTDPATPLHSAPEITSKSANPSNH